MIAILFKTDDGKKVDEIDVDENITSSIYSLYHDLKFCPAEEDGRIKAEKLKQWITEFEEGLIKNRQLRLADMVLGKLFAYSPKGKDGFCPAEEVRAIIEGRNSKTLENEYATAVFNSRGIYSSSGGNEERRLALMYKENADGIRILYPVTAKIYDDLYERYIYEADLERESDEYAGI